MNKKQYMVDTSVIVDNPLINFSKLYQNGENQIFITEVVIGEMEKHKTSENAEVKWSARTFFDAFPEEDMENILNGLNKEKFEAKRDGDTILKTVIQLENESMDLYIIYRKQYEKETLSGEGVPDAKIIEVAKTYGMRCVTNDNAFRIRANVEEMSAESLKWDSVEDPTSLDFASMFEVTENNKEAELKVIAEDSRKWEQITIHYVDEEGNRNNKRDYLLSNGDSLLPIRTEAKDFKDNAIKPMNMEQKFYAEMLSQHFNIFVVEGATGSGKTLLALVEGMNKVNSEDSPINGIIYMRYTVNAEDKFSALGFRKGDQDTKLGHFSYPLFGALNKIAEQKMLKKGTNRDDLKEHRNSIEKNVVTEELMKKFNIEVADMSLARGVTFDNKYIIFDEVQNAPNSMLKLIGTRVGKNTTLLLMGDSGQVDHPYLSTKRNGLLTMLKLAFEDEKGAGSMVASIQLKETVRSKTAKWFQEKLKV